MTADDTAADYALHVHEREPGAGTRVLTVDPPPTDLPATYDVSSTAQVQEIADSLGVALSRVKFAGGDFEHEADGA